MKPEIYLILAIALIAFITLLTRAIPFLLFGNRELPAFAKYLGTVLPPAIMVVLVCYCLKDISVYTFSGWVPELISCLIVTAVHLMRRNMYLSIIAGTACYMILTRLM